MGLTGDDLACALQACAWSYWGRNLNPVKEIPTWQAYYAFYGAHQTMMNFYSLVGTPAAKV